MQDRDIAIAVAMLLSLKCMKNLKVEGQSLRERNGHQFCLGSGVNVAPLSTFRCLKRIFIRVCV